MADDAVLIDTRGQTLVVTINTPARRNVLSRAVYEPVIQALSKARAEGLRSVIVTGAGGFFSAGGDLRMLKERREMPFEDRAAQIEYLHDMIRALRQSPLLVIAAVEGGAAGAGASMAFGCDMIVAAEQSYFKLAYVNAGLVPDGGGSGYLAMNLPRQMAMEMCLTGKPVLAERLFAMGVVNRLVPAGTALDSALALADDLANGPPQAQAAIKALINAPDDDRVASHLTRERGAMAQALGADEAAEGIRAFEEKRSPSF
ncbi:MAG: enoyl-CoA hydratase family protein [Marinibacterium sp.]|nr:enoyl-CoA hydratase family protein [Marinibacterium sp.]